MSSNSEEGLSILETAGGVHRHHCEITGTHVRIGDQPAAHDCRMQCIGLVTPQSSQCCGNPGKNHFSEGRNEDTSNQNILRSSYPFSMLDRISPRKVPTGTVSCKLKSERLHHQCPCLRNAFSTVRYCRGHSSVRSRSLCGRNPEREES